MIKQNWEEKKLYGYFKRQISEIVHKKHGHSYKKEI